MIKALIFDLDNCLAPATEVGKELYQPVLDAIRQANQQFLSEATLEQALADIWLHAFDWVVEKYCFTPAMRDAAWQQFSVMQVQKPMHGYHDIEVIPEFLVDRFLVTSGFKDLQLSKVNALNIGSQFNKIYVDAIDQPKRIGKRRIFQTILRENKILPSQVLVIGDNPHSEIAAGNSLGILTVQTLRPGVAKSSDAQFHIQSLSQLHPILETLNQT